MNPFEQFEIHTAESMDAILAAYRSLRETERERRAELAIRRSIMRKLHKRVAEDRALSAEQWFCE